MITDDGRRLFPTSTLDAQLGQTRALVADRELEAVGAFGDLEHHFGNGRQALGQNENDHQRDDDTKADQEHATHP